jgi:hypothetical protein
MAGLRFMVHGGPRTGTVVRARRRSDGVGSKRRGWGSLPRLAQDDEGAQAAVRRWTEVATGVPRLEAIRGAEVRKGGERPARCG